MSTLHRWFRSGAYSLLGHINLSQRRGRLGVLIVPPFGWEDVCSYRPLRSLAQALAANGIPTLRFDLPGTGDSSGDALDGGLCDAWIQSIGDAAAALRMAAGVEDVAVIGIRLGALLTLAAAARGSDVQDLVLWAPPATGRSALRELRAFSNVERPEYANGDPPPPPPIPGLEIAGFLIAPETQSALEALDVSKFPPMPGRRILVLTRDDIPAEPKLIRALESLGCAVEVKAGGGFAAMMAQPHEALPPEATGSTIVDFLKNGAPPLQSRLGQSRFSDTVPCRLGPAHPEATEIGGGVSESVYTVDGQSGSIFGILAEPGPKTPPSEWCVLFLNPGAVRHIGPNRMWVEAARRWAARGVPSLRLDVAGIGESSGEQGLDIPSLYQDELVEQVETAIDSLRARTGVRRFAAVGLCSGAFWAFHAAMRNRDIGAAILLNPRLFFWDPEVDRRRALRRTAKGLTDWMDWWRLARGEVRMDRIKQVARIAIDRFGSTGPAAHRQLQIQPKAMARAWRTIERNHTRLTLIFTEGEPLLREMEEEGQLPSPQASRVRCIRVANSGHTFRPLWAQKLAHEFIDAELEEVLRGSAPDFSPEKRILQFHSHKE